MKGASALAKSHIYGVLIDSSAWFAEHKCGALQSSGLTY
jgi:hypothetical protein